LGGPTKLYLVQHAEAKREEEDPDRPLTEKGKADIRKVTEFLKGKGLRASRMLHSGKLRARQTAEVLAEAISLESNVEQADGLGQLDDPDIWRSRLSKENKDIVLVGHLPHLARLTGLLLSGDPERKPVHFRNGGVVCLARDETGNWSVQWVLTPELLG